MLKTFLKNTEISNFMKIRSAGVESFHVDGRTDSRFPKFCEGAYKTTHKKEKPTDQYMQTCRTTTHSLNDSLLAHKKQQERRTTVEQRGNMDQ
jgi:TPP-dependent pyruvate/acetoin dehydrogenase alpha subunit